ncbi:MAG: di-heme oxidoredictase family protein [Pirellulales bacterium]
MLLLTCFTTTASLALAAEPAKEAIDVERQLRIGRELFTREWQPKGRNGVGDGLGPLFNERSCVACHKQGGIGGGGPAGNNVQIINVGKIDPKDPWFPTESYQRTLLFPSLEADKSSLVLHRFGMHPQYEVWRELRLEFADAESLLGEYEERVRQLKEVGIGPRSQTFVQNDGLLMIGRRVTERVTLLPLTKEERNTTALFGAGLIDGVRLETLEAVAEAQSKEIRGRPALLANGKVGRFGWKAQNVSLFDFNENACAVELGLETATRQEAALPVIFTRNPNASRYAVFREAVGEDVTRDEIQAMTNFVASLPQPRKSAASHKRIDAILGELVFGEIGCADCHTPKLGSISGIYSDLLLHRMGGYGSIYYGSSGTEDLASTRPPAVDEFRTPPLWGVADSAPYMHDGSAATLHDAIIAHGVQGDLAGKKYRELTAPQRRQLLGFLASLRAPDLNAAD